MGVSIINLIKKRIFLLFFSISFISYSQFYHGLEIGMNITNAEFNVDESVDPSSASGFFLGYVAERDLTDNLFLRIAVNFNRREFNAVSRRGINTTDEKWGTDLIEIPVNLGYYVNWNNKNLQFFVDAGINLGYNKRAFIKNDEETIRLDIGSDADIERIAMGANAGIGLLIKKRLKFRLNYYNSLSNIINTEGNNWKNKTFGLSVSYFVRDKIVY